MEILSQSKIATWPREKNQLLWSSLHFIKNTFVRTICTHFSSTLVFDIFQPCTCQALVAYSGQVTHNAGFSCKLKPSMVHNTPPGSCHHTVWLSSSKAVIHTSSAENVHQSGTVTINVDLSERNLFPNRLSPQHAAFRFQNLITFHAAWLWPLYDNYFKQ